MFPYITTLRNIYNIFMVLHGLNINGLQLNKTYNSHVRGRVGKIFRFPT